MAEPSGQGSGPDAAPLGIIAGGGGLPRQILESCRRRGRPAFVLALEGHADRGLADGWPHEWVRLGAVGAALDALKRQGCKDIVMAGRVARPSLTSLRPDLRGARLLARIGGRALGDDGLLRVIIEELEGEGLRVVSVDSVLDGVLAPVGPIGAARPDEEAMRDIARGLQAARAIGAADIGQGCVVQGGLVLAVEAVEGTDAMLARCADLAREGPGGVLVKACKPQQDERGGPAGDRTRYDRQRRRRRPARRRRGGGSIASDRSGSVDQGGGHAESLRFGVDGPDA